MKIKRLAIKNITSYRLRTEFVFDSRLNILIGPNGGGKSNLQKIIALILSHHFIRQYEFKYSDDERRIDPIDMWNRRQLERTLCRFVGDKSNQEIEIELLPEASDIENIRTIGSNLSEFNRQLSAYEHEFKDYAPYTVVDEIESSDSLKYQIKNFELEAPPEGSAAWGYREYLREFFIFMRLSSRIPGLRLSSPVFFFFSERASGKNLQVQTSQITEQNYFAGYRSTAQAAMGENTNLLQWGAQHFARLYWMAKNKASECDKTVMDFFGQEQDVQLLTRYMQQLGYEWNFATDEDSVSFSFVLKKGAHCFTLDRFSSGEKEIVHFLLALFALNVKDGLILVDEPELHLHPRWQRIFLGLFRELAPERNNQFVISTHSPVFVTPDTINSIVRIYQEADEGSDRIALRDVELPEKKNLVRIINSQNNERVFFAEKVVLVEGITDRLVFSSLVENCAALFNNNQAIEIVEVGGKTSFQDYRMLLEAMKTRSFVISDRDYLTIVGSTESKALFVFDPGKAWKALVKDKKSVDAKVMIARIDEAISTGDVSQLRAIREYIGTRHRTLKQTLDSAEQATIEADIARLACQRTFVLTAGEIEAYLPPSVADVRAVVEMTTNRNWINLVQDDFLRVELGQIACSILGATAEQSEMLLAALRTANVEFPLPISEAQADSVNGDISGNGS